MRPQLLLIPACLFCVSPAVADEFPTRKPGLWEIRIAVGGREMPLRNIQQCTDAETDALMTTNVGAAAGSDCSKPTISRNGGSVTVDSTCRIGSTMTATRAVFSGDFDRAYTVAVSSRPAGREAQGAGPSGEPQMTMEARWVGPCRQGQRPGDIIMPGGFKMNVRELAPAAATPGR